MKDSIALFLAATIYIAPHASHLVAWCVCIALTVVGVCLYVKGR